MKKTLLVTAVILMLVIAISALPALAWSGGFGAWSGGYGTWAGAYGSWSGGYNSWAGAIGNWAGGMNYAH